MHDSDNTGLVDPRREPIEPKGVNQEGVSKVTEEPRKLPRGGHQKSPSPQVKPIDLWRKKYVTSFGTKAAGSELNLSPFE